MSIAVAIHPIRTDADHEAALRRIETLMGATPGTPEADELDVLTDLVEVYESRHYPVAASSPRRVLSALMEAPGLTQSDLPEIGSQGVVSEILRGKREMNLRQVRVIARRFRVSPATLV